MKCKCLFLAALAFAVMGCEQIENQRKGAYVGDSSTKLFYRNIGEYTDSIPEERRIYFPSIVDAMNQGYRSATGTAH